MKTVDEMIKGDKYYKALYHNLWQKIWEHRPETVLVMGCHAGWDAEYLLKNSAVKHITIIEPVEWFVNKYKEDFRDKSNVDVLKGSWESTISFKRKFDMALCFDCIEHSPKPLSIVKNLMVYSDKLAISMPNGKWNFRDGLRNEDHGHGPHIQHYGFGDIRQLFDGFGSTEIKPVRADLLGRFGFGMFVFVNMD
ncbi:class I SAM-dependent methyltransferase [Patescibacteria group bacterium]|nr:class I SAM-dependent methyltransferase [Patescibacteria group bacterium]